MIGNAMIETILFAVITIGLLWRYKDILGTRPDEDMNKASVGGGGVSKSSWLHTPQLVDVTPIDDDTPMSLSAVLDRMTALDTTFTERRFVEGARLAHKMIVSAVFDGTLSTVESLITPACLEVLKHHPDFDTKVNLQSIRQASLTAATLQQSVGHITVEFIREQSYPASHEKNKPKLVTESWSFQRDFKNANPNWQLVGYTIP
jgi:predicted lipid-binding transport protein (Tim44 family)